MGEVEKVVEMIEDMMLDDAPPALVGRSTFRAVAWALLHPFRFNEERGRFHGLRKAVERIEAGDHLLNNPNA